MWPGGNSAAACSVSEGGEECEELRVSATMTFWTERRTHGDLSEHNHGEQRWRCKTVSAASRTEAGTRYQTSALRGIVPVAARGRCVCDVCVYIYIHIRSDH